MYYEEGWTKHTCVTKWAVILNSDKVYQAQLAIIFASDTVHRQYPLQCLFQFTQEKKQKTLGP